MKLKVLLFVYQYPYIQVLKLHYTVEHGVMLFYLKLHISWQASTTWEFCHHKLIAKVRIWQANKSLKLGPIVSALLL